MSRHATDPHAAAKRAARAIEDEFQTHQIWAEETLSVRNKQGELIPYQMGPAQLKVVRAIKKQRAKGIPARVAFLGGVDHSTVDPLRNTLSGEIRQIERKVERQGTEYTQKVSLRPNPKERPNRTVKRIVQRWREH